MPVNLQKRFLVSHATKAAWRRLYLEIDPIFELQQDQFLTATAVVLEEDKDFETIKIDPLCIPFDIVPKNGVESRSKRIFCAWIEECESKRVVGKGDLVLE